MMPSRTFWRRIWRRLCAGMVLLCYLLTALNLPLPAAQPKKTEGVAFPCQDHPCGCRTAEQCWRGCCCFTVEERWAWARAHNVQPPAYAEKPATQGWQTTRLRDQDKPQAGCAHCSDRGGNSLTSRQTSCCKTEAHGKPGKPSKVGWVQGLNAMRCQGHGTYWLTSGAVLPPAPPLSWNPHFELAGWLASIDSLPVVRTFTPLDPPPRPFRT